jgi:hypothetical protein
MAYIIAVFKSRNETLYFANLLRNNNVQSFVVNTPKEAGLSCGISVKIEERFFPLAKYLLASKPFRAFHGFYRVHTNGMKSSFERL